MLQGLKGANSIGECLRQTSILNAAKRLAGCSDAYVFPIPLTRAADRFLAHSDATRWKAVDAAVNCMVTCLNLLYYSGAPRQAAARPISRAHSRVHACLHSSMATFLTSSGAVATEVEIKQYLQRDVSYSEGGVALELGLRGGVPDVAGDVPLSHILERDDPEYAKQVSDPDRLLLPFDERPEKLKNDLPGWTRLTLLWLPNNVMWDCSRCFQSLRLLGTTVEL